MTPAAHPPTTLRRIRRSRSSVATAYHEAGHAVARVALGYAVRRVALTPELSDRLGVCEGYRSRAASADLGWGFWPARRLRAEIVIRLAGDEGQRLYLGRRDHVGASLDYADAADMAFALAGGDAGKAQAALRRCERRAEALIAGRRGAVRRVAEALLAADTLSLTGRQVVAIVGGGPDSR